MKGPIERAFNKRAAALTVALALISVEKGDKGKIQCPLCKKKALTLRWFRVKSNGHTRGACETESCLSWIQ